MQRKNRLQFAKLHVYERKIMLFFPIALTVLMLLVIYYDATRYTIPNWLCQLVVVLYCAAMLLVPHLRAPLNMVELSMVAGLLALMIVPLTMKLGVKESVVSAVMWSISLLMIGALLLTVYALFDLPAAQMLRETMPQSTIMGNEGVSVMGSFVAMLIVFVFGIFVFAMRWIGGGDVKLLAALAFWCSTHSSIELIFGMGLLGGLLIIPLIMLRDVVHPKDEEILEWKKEGGLSLVMRPFYALVRYVLLIWRYLTMPLRNWSRSHINPEKLPQILRAGEPMAYGVPIAIVFMVLLWRGYVPYLPMG